ncbi:MAG: hypothetical protein P8Y96_08400 [Desulfuromonadales bacterium]|jgi:transcription elongation factor Elf1
MAVSRLILVACIGLALLTACSLKSSPQKGRVNCPACGYEFDALIQGNF